jgi:hypothetical protein
VGGSGLRRWLPSRHRSGPWGGPGETRPTALKRYESPGQPSTAASLYTLMGAARYPRWGPAGTPPVKDTETERKRAAALHSLAVHRLARHAASRPRGTLGAHQRKICQEALRTCEISAAGQTVCRVPPPRSRASRHKTRPTGRLTLGVVPLVPGLEAAPPRRPSPGLAIGQPCLRRIRPAPG